MKIINNADNNNNDVAIGIKEAIVPMKWELGMISKENLEKSA